MPKGALLHAHLDATVNASFLLDLALKQPAMHIKVPQIINASNLQTTLPTFRGLPQGFADAVSSLTGSSYAPETWVTIQNARENFDPSLGGPEGFDRWVIGTMMINPAEAYGTHNTITKVWLNPFTERLAQIINVMYIADMGEVHEHLYCFHSTFNERHLFHYFLTIGGKGLIRFAPIFSEYIREFLLSSIEDGISYIEARVNFLYKYLSSSSSL